jgi:hypothetical protein
VPERLTFQGEAVVLRLLLADLLSQKATGFSPLSLDEEEQYAIAATYFLLDVKERVGVERFATYTLGRILSQLSRQTERQHVVYSGQVRGFINWPRTIKARHSDDYDPTRYVCREVKRRYDTLENQLLKYVVEEIYKCLLAVPPVMRQGACYYPAATETRHPPVTTAIRLGRIETALNQARYNVRYREIPRPAIITPEHQSSAQLSRQEEYADVAHLYHHLQGAIHAPDWWRTLTPTGRRVLPLPARADAEGELWLQLGAAILRNEMATKE